MRWIQLRAPRPKQVQWEGGDKRRERLVERCKGLLGSPIK